ncbi:MAG: HNH endonuclease signature motif containing protein [Acidimicrobiales bacterium]
MLASDGGRCYWPGCDAPAHRCQIDHLIGWEQGGATDIDNLGPICGFHNRLKHRGRYQAGRGPDGRIEVRDRDGNPIGARPAPADRAPP